MSAFLGMSRPQRALLPPRATCEALGVTRVARVTGLDRTGVEVACAVRPGGHVLQVSNGKGRSWPEAARGAVSEAAELWASEHPEPALLRWGTPEELARHVGADAVWDATLLGDETPVPPDVRAAWAPAEELSSGATVLVPACAVYCPPPGGPYLGPATVAWTSNGLAVHPSPEEARVRALLEACERHLLALALPEGFTEAVVRRSRVPAAQLQALAPAVARRVEALESRGFEVALFLPDAGRGRGRVALPLAAALLFDAEEGPHPLTAGYACRPRTADALEAALLEAAQSRLTDIHGAREDIAPPDVEGARQLRALCGERAGRRTGPVLPRELTGRSLLRPLLGRLREAGFPRVAASALPLPLSGLHAVKVLVPGFLRSELL